MFSLVINKKLLESKFDVSVCKLYRYTENSDNPTQIISKHVEEIKIITEENRYIKIILKNLIPYKSISINFLTDLFSVEMGTLKFKNLKLIHPVIFEPLRLSYDIELYGEKDD